MGGRSGFGSATVPIPAAQAPAAAGPGGPNYLKLPSCGSRFASMARPRTGITAPLDCFNDCEAQGGSNLHAQAGSGMSSYLMLRPAHLSELFQILEPGQ